MDRISIQILRQRRPSEQALRIAMIALAALFLLLGILLSRGLMLPCFLMAMAYFWYSHASRREYEYTLEDGHMTIERAASSGRTVLHEINLADVEALASPDDPCVARYKKGGEEKIRKFDYTSDEENRPY